MYHCPLRLFLSKQTAKTLMNWGKHILPGYSLFAKVPVLGIIFSCKSDILS